ncbi:hypothetical protein [Streptomyces sp. MK37H]|uniref:hypothetical protein n=1 Tax=Streptomyces sp. MK37H TaxID=2699117 RepID=UPI001B37F1F0|nr:hypothetical protein [Streptomyces sp. MK37H]MBP8539428.1 hypothetical protein [Streptomyces sp. MK37H]
MVNLTPWEQEWVQIQEDLRQSPGVRVFQDVRGDIREGDLLRDAGDSGGGPHFAQSLYGRSVRFSEIGSQWQTVEPYGFVVGEFFLTPLKQAVHEDPPDFTSSFYSDEEQRIGQELRVIDDTPFTGAGSFTAIRLDPESTGSEVWFSDHLRGLWRMDLDYSTYVDLLRLTKGAFGWQHLFTQAPLEDEEFQRTADRIVNMLDALPQIFPDRDYTPLRKRWEARL